MSAQTEFHFSAVRDTAGDGSQRPGGDHAGLDDTAQAAGRRGAGGERNHRGSGRRCHAGGFAAPEPRARDRRPCHGAGQGQRDQPDR